MEDSNATTPKLKRSTYLSAMIGSSRRQSGGEWSITSSDEASTSTYTTQHNLLLPAPKASGSRRKLRHALNNEGQQNSSTTMSNRDYFNLRRPKGTTAHQGRQLRRGSTSTTAASGGDAVSFGAGGVPLASSASLGLPATTGSNGGSAASLASTHSNSRRRRVSADQRGRGGSLSSSFNKSNQRSNSLQYYYPNPFSTTNLNDLMRLQQQQQQSGNTASSQVPSAHSTSSSSGQDDRLDTAWLDQLDRQDSLLRDTNKNNDDNTEEEEEESIAPLSYNNKRRNKKRQLPSGHRSLPQLQAAAATTTLPTHNHNNSYSTLNYFNNHHNHTMSCHCKRNFFQQVLDPIDGSDNDVNSRRRNEAWKEIRYNDNDDTAMMGYSNEVGVRVEEVSDDECRVNGGGGVKCRHQGIGSLLGECCMDSGGIVSDDNDVSCSEESKTDTIAKRGGEGGRSSPSSWSGVPLPSSQRKRKSVDDSSSMSGEEDDNNTSPPTSLVGVPSQPPPRRVNTIGAGLAYGSDAWRSYQSKLDVKGGSSLSRFRLSSSLGR
eukprot:scaffold19978_cov86-Skeletonema_dohrnii-CCMP3373.AAC.2